MRRAAALAAVVVCLVVAQRLVHSHQASLGDRATVTNADSLRLGRLTLSGCDIGDTGGNGVATLHAYCGAFAVPEDWQALHGRQIELRVAIVKAAAATPDADLVVFLDGGPGGAATRDWPQVAPAFEPLRERHDILLIDQRGTGGSNALDCSQLREQNDAEGQFAQTDQPAQLTPRLSECLMHLRARAAPRFYTTTEAVRDLEAVREALGAPRLDLVGISYGTRVAQQYAAHYAQGVRSIVLDSPVPNTLALLSEHARNLESALQALFAQCRAAAVCRARFGDPYATLYRVRDRLSAHPQQMLLRDPVSFQPLQLTFTAADLAAVVRFYAYSPLTAALLPLMLSEADGGNYAPLLGQKKWLTDDLGDQITGGMELSVICAEDVDLLAPRPQDADTLLGNGIIERAKSACAHWPHGRRPVDFHAPLVSALPVLVLSGQFDPVTPPAYGEQIVRTLSHGRQLIVPGQGHGVIEAGCVPRLVDRFVQTLDAPGLQAQCLQQLGDAPAFLDYNGAGP